MMSSSSSIIRFPFTASQWQELEHQALVFKYMVSGMPVPPDLLFTITTNFDSSLSSNFLIHQPQHIAGWNSCLEMGGFGRKIDPEPGRCRRTDGKKWRCSKEAYPDSKYCERHMHRGRNRSRKPVEIIINNNNIAANSTKNTPITSFLSPHNNYSSSRRTINALSSSSSSQDNKHTNFNFLDQLHSANVHSPQPTKDSRNSILYGHNGDGTKSEISEEEEHAIFRSEGNYSPLSGHINNNKHNNIAAAAYYYNSCDDLQLSKQNININKKDDNYCACSTVDDDDDIVPAAKKVMHHFIDEWSPPNKGQDYYYSNNSHDQEYHTTTHLSISIPNSLHDFFHDTNMKKT